MRTWQFDISCWKIRFDAVWRCENEIVRSVVKVSKISAMIEEMRIEIQIISFNNTGDGGTLSAELFVNLKSRQRKSYEGLSALLPPSSLFIIWKSHLRNKSNILISWSDCLLFCFLFIKFGTLSIWFAIRARLSILIHDKRWVVSVSCIRIFNLRPARKSC